MMVKSGLEFLILKLNEPLQCCCCPMQKNLPRKAELVQFQKMKNSRPLFTIICKPKIVISRVYSTYRMSFRTLKDQ